MYNLNFYINFKSNDKTLAISAHIGIVITQAHTIFLASIHLTDDNL